MIQNSATLKSYFETGDKPTESQFSDLIDTIFNGTLAIPKQFSFVFMQEGTNAPTMDVKRNTLGGLPVFTRVGVGDYDFTLTNAFTIDKTYFNYSRVLTSGVLIVASRQSVNVIKFYLTDFSGNAIEDIPISLNDGFLVNIFIDN